MEPTEYFTVEQVAREVRLTKEKVIVYCKAIERYSGNKDYFIRNEKNRRLFSLDNLLLIESIKKEKSLNKGTLMESVEKTMTITEFKIVEEKAPYEQLTIEINEIKKQMTELINLNIEIKKEFTLQKDLETTLLIKEAQECYPNLFPTYSKKVHSTKGFRDKLNLLVDTWLR